MYLYGISTSNYLMKSFKLKLNLSYEQELILNTLSNEHRLLYNHLLDLCKTTSNFKLLQEETKKYRTENNLTIKYQAAQITKNKLINAISGFFKVRKSNPEAKFPYRFKSWKYFFSFQYDRNGEFKIEDDNLKVYVGDGHVKNSKSLNFKLPQVVSERGINKDTIKTITFKKEENKYYCVLTYSETPKISNLNRDNFMSIDLGVSKIVTCYSNKIDSFGIENNHFKKLKKTYSEISSRLSKKVKGSKKFLKLKTKKIKICKKLSNKNKDFQHKISKKIINICVQNDIGTLVVGDIKTKNLTKGKFSFKRLNESTQNNGTLSRFKTFLAYKSKDADINFELLNESYTSQENSLTGIRGLDSNLKIRTVRLSSDIEIDRDLNSAINISKRRKGNCSIQSDNLREQIKKSSKNYRTMYMTNESYLYTTS